MRLLLTSAGVKNASIHDALVQLLGRPISESRALCIPTAMYAMPGGPEAAFRFVSGSSSTPLCELGWRSLGVLELSALPSLGEQAWLPMLEETDALLVGGGDALYLSHWLRRSGLEARLRTLDHDTVYVSVSAGGMALAPKVGEEFIGWRPPDGSERALGVVDFAMFPHLDHVDLPSNCMANAETWAAALDVPAYAIDDQTAIRVIDGTPEIVSEGHWRRFMPAGGG